MRSCCPRCLLLPTSGTDIAAAADRPGLFEEGPSNLTAAGLGSLQEEHRDTVKYQAKPMGAHRWPRTIPTYLFIFVNLPDERPFVNHSLCGEVQSLRQRRETSSDLFAAVFN